MEKEGVMVNVGRAVIDTRPPFRSVKEAVALFGEKVLVGEIYAKQFKDKEIQTSKEEEHHQVTPPPPPSPYVVENVTTTEPKETKQNLKKAKEEEEEDDYMVNCLKSLKEELEQTKNELQQLKAAKQTIVIDQHPRNNDDLIINPEIEELKYIETNNNNVMSKRDIIDEDDDHHDIQKKKFVSFASPPSLTRDIRKNNSRNNNNSKNNDDVGGVDYGKFGRTPSFRKEGKKKPVIPIVGWLFSNKKNKDKYQYDG